MITILMLGGAKRVSVARHIKDAFRALGHQARVLSYELDWRVPAVAVAEVIQGRRWKALCCPSWTRPWSCAPG